jgi:AbrB family looped-hinge helix DNA binding protein
MPAATVTSKGQVTIPKVIRDAMGVRPGDRVRFTRREDGTVVVEPETVDVRSLRGSLKGFAKRVVTVEEMNEAIADAVADRHRRATSE